MDENQTVESALQPLKLGAVKVFDANLNVITEDADLQSWVDAIESVAVEPLLPWKAAPDQNGKGGSGKVRREG